MAERVNQNQIRDLVAYADLAERNNVPVTLRPERLRDLLADLQQARDEAERLRAGLVAVVETTQRHTEDVVGMYLVAGVARGALGLCPSCGRQKGGDCARGEC